MDDAELQQGSEATRHSVGRGPLKWAAFGALATAAAAGLVWSLSDRRAVPVPSLPRAPVVIQAIPPAIPPAIPGPLAPVNGEVRSPAERTGEGDAARVTSADARQGLDPRDVPMIVRSGVVGPPVPDGQGSDSVAAQAPILPAQPEAAQTAPAQTSPALARPSVPARVPERPAATERSDEKPPATGTGARRLNINVATKAELELLPDIGPKLAQAIIDYRLKHGPLQRLEDLDNVKGVGEKTLKKLAPLITFESSGAGR